MKPYILVVDDDPQIFEVLSGILHEEGFDVLWARNPEEFQLKTLSGRKPDLIMLDIALGNENGPDVYKRLLIQGLDRGIPVIFISGLIQNHDSEPPVRAGRLYAMHGKPFEFDRLLSDIRSLTSMA